MFSHIMIGTNDLDRAKSFYDKLLGTLGVQPAVVDRHRIFYRTKTGTFSVSDPNRWQTSHRGQWRDYWFYSRVSRGSRGLARDGDRERRPQHARTHLASVRWAM